MTGDLLFRDAVAVCLMSAVANRLLPAPCATASGIYKSELPAMKRARRTTAEELREQLNKDAEYMARKEQETCRIEQEEARWQAAFRPYVIAINRLGFPGDSLERILAINAPLPEPIVDVLARATAELTHPRHVEMVVRALSASAAAYDGTVIARIFDATGDEALRWACINTIATSAAVNLDQWLTELPAYWVDVLHGCRNRYPRK